VGRWVLLEMRLVLVVLEGKPLWGIAYNQFAIIITGNSIGLLEIFGKRCVETLGLKAACVFRIL
jgi:hypothetical protein